MSCLTEYNEAETMNMLKEEAREEGLAEGREEGIKMSIQNVAASLMAANVSLSKEDALNEATRMVTGEK